jgi:hypothetical protein
VHAQAVTPPITARNLSLAKGLAAEAAQKALQDLESPFYLEKVCDCIKVDVDVNVKAGEVQVKVGEVGKGVFVTGHVGELVREEVDEEEMPPNDETEEGFAMRGMALAVEEVWRGGGGDVSSGGEGYGGESGYESEDEESAGEGKEMMEVEMMLRVCDDWEESDLEPEPEPGRRRGLRVLVEDEDEDV